MLWPLMSIEKIRKLRNAKPFSAFDIFTTDGRLLPVDRPSSIALAPSGRTVSVVDGPAFSILEVGKIRSLNVEESKPERGSGSAQ